MKMKFLATCLVLVTATSAHSDVLIDGGEGEDQIILDMGNAAAGTRKTFVPTADFQLLLDRAKDSSNLRRQLEQFSQMRANPNMRDMLLQEMVGRVPGARDGITTPLHYAALDQIEHARARAQYFSQMLVADLDNDGQITQQELKDTLELAEADGVAEAFFSSDANNDAVLSADELRAAVDHRLSLRGGYGGRDRSGMLRLFDFDDDGYLTPEEYQRALAAFGLTKP